MKKLTLGLGMALFLQWQASGAATLIEERDSESTNIMYVENGKMRTESAGQAGYVLIDLRQRSMIMVDPAEKQAIDMSSLVFGGRGGQAETAESSVESSLDALGPGPEIAGYATEHFVLRAEGRKCQDLFTSRRAFEDSGWADFWDDVRETMRQLSVAGSDADACDIAEANLVDPASLGWPVKTIYPDGETVEIARIQKGVPVPVGGFDVPPDYVVLSMEDMLSGGVAGGTATPDPGTNSESGIDKTELREDDSR